MLDVTLYLAFYRHQADLFRTAARAMSYWPSASFHCPSSCTSLPVTSLGLLPSSRLHQPDELDDVPVGSDPKS